MQAQCPQCAQRIVIDDAKVPDKPFAVKCPKCQTIVRLPGKAAPAPEPEPELSFEEPRLPDPPHPPPPSPSPLTVGQAAEPSSLGMQDEMRSQVMAQLRREMSGPGAEPSSHERALVSIPDRAQAAAITLILTRLGYNVDSVEEHEDAARFVEQGAYAVAATTRAGAGPGRESLYQRITRLSPDQRRRLFVILVGDEFKSGDSVQAFAVIADLVLSTRDAAGADNLMRTVMTDRKRLYQIFLDARRRFEAAAG